MQGQNQLPPQGGAMPQQGQRPMPQAGAPQQGQQDPLSFIQELHDLLLVRIEAQGQKNPNFGAAIDAGVSPEAAQELMLILPEIKPIYDAIEAAERGQQPINGGGAPMPQQGQPQQMQQEENPILRDTPAGVSRGLVG